MIFEEKTVSSEKIFDGKIIKLRLDKVAMPDGSLADRELIDHPGGVGIVALTDDDKIILVKQYRKPIEKAIYEVPAGKLDAGEGHYACGVRELEEETGYRAERFEYMGFIYPSPGYANELTHLYLATGLKKGEIHPDEDEFLDVEYMDFSKAKEMVMNNEIHDAKSVYGILKAAVIIGK